MSSTWTYKAFDTVPHDVLVFKLEIHRFGAWIIQNNWLDGCPQRAVVNSLMGKKRAVAGGDPQG